MRWKTARKRLQRNIWKRRGHAHIVFNRGIYFNVSGTEYYLILGGHIQPRAYYKYPHP